ncbi:MAG: 23S rRNA (pseudouridine(1915)-N(3))-methyltransferase RlmH [Deltaproteobacteria bacterium]
MRFEFLFLGKTREKFLAAGIDHFLERLNHYLTAEVKIIKEKRWSPREAEDKIREEEGNLLLARRSQPSLVVALDPGGRQVSSEELAELVAGWQEAGQRCVSFLIGGPLGLPEKLVAEADAALSLSRMTFTHEMARLILMEQLYRAFTILAGTGYHK